MADIAGMPKSIVKRANIVLKELEADTHKWEVLENHQQRSLSRVGEGGSAILFQLDDPVLTQIRDEDYRIRY